MHAEIKAKLGRLDALIPAELPKKRKERRHRLWAGDRGELNKSALSSTGIYLP